MSKHNQVLSDIEPAWELSVLVQANSKLRVVMACWRAQSTTTTTGMGLVCLLVSSPASRLKIIRIETKLIELL